MRYRDDFEPPTRKRPLQMDEAPFALFHFDGDLAAEGTGGKPITELR